MTVPIITVDGPSGSGKGTLSQRLAAHYQFNLLDSGSLYRILGLYVAEQGWIDDIAQHLDTIVYQTERLAVDYRIEKQQVVVYLDGKNVSQTIRSEEVGQYASKVAVVAELRQALFARQLAFARKPGLVADGRDMGTVVFPAAAAKIFLVASAQSRACRRENQLRDMGVDANIDSILSNIVERDARDTARAVSPLIAAGDALTIDSSDMTIEQVFTQSVAFVDRCLKKNLMVFSGVVV